MGVMIRIGMVVVTMVSVVACGGAATPHHGSTRPPAATITDATGIHRLAMGSFCWTAHSGSSGVTGCADGPAPALMPNLPVVRVHAGQTVLVRLRFTPTAPVEATIGSARYRLPAASVLRLRVRRGGFLMVDPRHGHDDVEYLARIVMSS